MRPETTGYKSRTGRVNECYVHRDVKVDLREEIRNSVCVNDIPLLRHTDGKYYCLFHLPTSDKDLEAFEEIFNSRLEWFEEKGSYAEYDFRFTWFPSDVDLAERTFNKAVCFDGATFSGEAGFIDTVFKGQASFRDVNFRERAEFNDAEFGARVMFYSAVFTGHAAFIDTKFIGKAYFADAVFSDDAEFEGSTFHSHTTFRNCRVEKKAIFWVSVFLADCDFFRTRFKGEANFLEAKFSGGVSFRCARFYESCNFNKVEFVGEKLFRWTVFRNGVNFKSATFSDNTFFDKAHFYGFVDFGSVIFLSDSDTLFRKTTFHENVNFGYAAFGGYTTFESQRGNAVFNTAAFVNFQHAYTERSEKIGFNHVTLHPCWFINIDPRNFFFKGVSWERVDDDFTRSNVEAELKKLKEWEELAKRKIEKPKSVFRITCRQLAENAENNSRFDEASNFRRMAMETEWLEKKEHLTLNFKRLWRSGRNSGSVNGDLSKPFFSAGRATGDIFIHGLYRITSFYGESSFWAAIMLLGVLLFFSILYVSPLSRFDYSGKSEPVAGEQLNFIDRLTCESSTASPRSMNMCEGLSYSLYLTALQRPEPKPYDNRTKFWVILETFLGPLQAALLALAIRRKFMR